MQAGSDSSNLPSTSRTLGKKPAQGIQEVVVAEALWQEELV